MEISQAAGSKVYVRGFAGQDWRLPLLDMVDLGELQREVPLPGGRSFADIFEIAEWAKTIDGAQAILLRIFQKVDPDIGDSRLKQMGSIAQRVRLATALVTDSLVSGEEGMGGDEKKAESHGTG